VVVGSDRSIRRFLGQAAILTRCGQVLVSRGAVLGRGTLHGVRHGRFIGRWMPISPFL